MSELPSGWVHGSLGDVLRIRNGYAFKSTEFKLDGVPLVRQSNLDGDKVDLSKCVYLDERYLTERAGFTLNKGDVLIGMSGSVGKLCTYDQDFVALQNQRVGKIELHIPDQTEWRFIWHYLKTVTDALLDKAKGVAVANVSPDDIHSLPLNIPPLAEQTRIAAKLDELLAQVDTLKARIDGIPALLKRFRQSVLAAAVSGRLTDEWREKNTGDLGFLLNPKVKALGIEELASAEELLTEPLPTFWKKYALEQLVEPDRGIPYGIVQTGSAVEKGIPTVRCGDVKNLFIDTSSLKKVSPEIEHEYKRTRLKGSEVLLAIRGSVGNAGVVPAALRDCNISREVAMIPTLPSVLPFYLACLLQSPLGQRLLVGKVRGVAQKGINLADVRRLPVALPPYAEQTEIVHRVEKLLAFAEQLEAKVASAKSRIDHLTQSILAKAFRGELVPQDPNDEPASVLLERIKTQRATAPKARRGRGKSMSAWTAATEGT